MPRKNVNKIQIPNSFYHIYIRGNNKQSIFNEDIDYKYFIKLIVRYLSQESLTDTNGRIYPSFTGKIDLLAYCLISNHYHLLVYQIETPYLEKFMRSIMTSYSRYFNLKYKRSGPVFESRYKAVLTDQDSYLQHISRYIHLNPDRWDRYKYSSLKYYRDGNPPFWLNTNRILEMFPSTENYINFVSNYKEMHDELGELIHQLADR
jgi:putative transposase